MKILALCVYVVLCAQFAHSQAEPMVVVDNVSISHEHKGWRVIAASATPVHFNLMKGDLIVRIDGKNAAETGPMVMATLFNQENRRAVRLFIERGSLRLEILLREIRGQDYDPVGANPFKHVATGFSAPEAEFKDIDGQPVSLEQFKGKWLLIDFMGTWCAPCMESMSSVLNVVNHHQLTLVMIALNDKPQALRRMQQAYKISSPIAMMQWTSQLPIDFGVATNLWTGQIPAFVLINPDGEVALIALGGCTACDMEKAIEMVMSGTPDEASK